MQFLQGLSPPSRECDQAGAERDATKQLQTELNLSWGPVSLLDLVQVTNVYFLPWLWNKTRDPYA